jgi:2'-5' RNA ligase
MNSNLTRALDGIVSKVKQALPSTKRKQKIERAAWQTFQAARQRGEQRRSAPIPPQDMEEAGNPALRAAYHGHIIIDERQQSLVSSQMAEYTRVTSAAGWTPIGTEMLPELTPMYIGSVHGRTDRTGWCDNLDDLTRRCLRYDEHLQSVDRIRRTAVFDAPVRVKPCNSTQLAVLVANAVRAIVDDVDGFTSTLGELGYANASGFAVSEIIYRPRRIRVAIDARTAVTIDAKCIASMEPVSNRNVVWDIVSDRPYLRMGGGVIDLQRAVDGRALRKFVLHKGFGDGPTRSRGYQYAAHYLTQMTGMTVGKWAVILSTYGLSTPYLSFDEESGADLLPEDIADAEDTLSDLGNGVGRILRKAWGEVKTTPVPTGMYDLHQAILGYLNSQKSKLVVSNTLTQEMGSQVGSYNASSTHSDQQLATQRMDAAMMSETLRTQLVRFLVDKNAEAFARAFSPYIVGGCTPADVRACAPRIVIEVNPKLSQPERLKMFLDVKGAGIEIDPDQLREETGIRPAANPTFATEQALQTRAFVPVEDERISVAVLLPLPLDVAKQIAIPGFEQPEDLHVTVATVETSPDNVPAMCAELEPLLSQAHTIKLVKPIVFDVVGDDDQPGEAWCMSVDGVDDLHDAVSSVLAKYGELDQRGYVAHCTLAYRFDTSEDHTFRAVDIASKMPQPVAFEIAGGALSLSSKAHPSEWIRFGEGADSLP